MGPGGTCEQWGFIYRLASASEHPDILLGQQVLLEKGGDGEGTLEAYSPWEAFTLVLLLLGGIGELGF